MFKDTFNEVFFVVVVLGIIIFEDIFHSACLRCSWMGFTMMCRAWHRHGLSMQALHNICQVASLKGQDLKPMQTASATKVDDKVELIYNIKKTKSWLQLQRNVPQGKRV